MISARTPPCTRLFSPRTAVKAFATVRGLRQSTTQEAEETEAPEGANDFILSILRARPSLRDSKSYLASFGPRPAFPHVPARDSIPSTLPLRKSLDQPAAKPTPLVESILDPVHRRTALVKFQGPFNEHQLESIARGMVYLEKLGLVSVIVVESDDWKRGEEGEREKAISEVMRVVSALERQGAKARPILAPAVRLGPRPDETSGSHEPEFTKAHTVPSDLVAIRSALRAGEIPVVPPIVLDSFCRSVRVDGNNVVAALARGMVEAAEGDRDTSDMDLTPLRLMIISREGGIPSYARSGLPHLLVNLTSETQHIHDTYMQRWNTTHPTALANMKLAKKCLEYMPRTSSAVMVSHRSPSSLIANLITNKPAQSSSLPHALLSGTKKLTPDTPTLLRHGLPIRVIRNVADLDKAKMTSLLETSFGRVLDTEAFYKRIDDRLDFAIVAGDYAGAAIVTNEGEGPDRIAYLDKFAVLPSHQGDGTVDFLWVALHDESYGLGLPNSLNPNGGMEGMGTGRDLVWRSRANNPVNKWYFERSSGHVRLGEWVLFWCDAEDRLKNLAKERKATSMLPARKDELSLLQFVERDECGRLGTWAAVASSISSSWQR